MYARTPIKKLVGSNTAPIKMQQEHKIQLGKNHIRSHQFQGVSGSVHRPFFPMARVRLLDPDLKYDSQDISKGGNFTCFYINFSSFFNNPKRYYALSRCYRCIMLHKKAAYGIPHLSAPIILLREGFKSKNLKSLQIISSLHTKQFRSNKNCDI